MRITQLRAFDAVARLGGFTTAADRLRLTQPAITIQVRALEEAYGVKLFIRRGGTTELTDAGQGLFERTQDLFSAEDRVRDYLDKSEKLNIGDIHISADGPHLAMGLIAAFRVQYPNIRMSVSLGNTHDVWRDLMEGSSDAVIVANPPKEMRVITFKLGERGLQALVPAGHAWARRKSIGFNEMSNQPGILREIQSNTRKLLEQAFKKHNIRTDVVLELGSREAVVEAVAAGLGIGFAFEGEVPSDTRVIAVPIDGLERQNLDTVACLKSQRHRGVVKAFLDVAKEWNETRK